ncbi:hypothetical protein L1049_020782 [Liquidambar formosana]|uniref:Uncharacterized protein n=1 Tax=Liquidambar formosana TaxID=63359 RepID=A0AAP0SD81_LIQFO
MNGIEMTRWHHISGLPSKLLSRNDAHVLVMIGMGSLALHLIKALIMARLSLRKVITWNRMVERVRKGFRGRVESDGFALESSGCLEEFVKLGNIVSCAKNADISLVKGEELKGRCTFRFGWVV